MWVIDIKSTEKSPSPEQANRAIELTVYACLMACTFGFHCEIPTSLLYLVRTKEPKIVWLNAIHKLENFINLYETILNVSQAINQGLFWKNQGINCSWCDYQDICFGKPLAA